MQRPKKLYVVFGRDRTTGERRTFWAGGDAKEVRRQFKAAEALENDFDLLLRATYVAAHSQKRTLGMHAEVARLRKLLARAADEIGLRGRADLAREIRETLSNGTSPNVATDK